MKIAVLLIAMMATSVAGAQTYVAPHVRQDGTYVQGHMRSAPDRNPYNNYSTQGNVNPYSGSAGTRDAYNVHQDYKPQQYNHYEQPNNGRVTRDRW